MMGIELKVLLVLVVGTWAATCILSKAKKIPNSRHSNGQSSDSQKKTAEIQQLFLGI